MIVFPEAANQPFYRICNQNREVGTTIPEKELSLKGSCLTHNALGVPACERLIVL